MSALNEKDALQNLARTVMEEITTRTVLLLYCFALAVGAIAEWFMDGWVHALLALGMVALLVAVYAWLPYKNVPLVRFFEQKTDGGAKWER